MKTKVQILAVLCLALAGCARAQSHLGGTGGTGGTGGWQSAGTPHLQLLPPFQFSTTVGASFSQTLTSAYGVGTLAWSEIGALPAGLSLNSGAGTISGTVGNNAGIYNFTVTVTDSSSPPQVATQNFSISVLCTPLQLTGPVTWPPADNGTAYNYTVPVSGGIAPLTFTATNLPSAETINTSTGVVSGTPGTTGIFSNIGITVTDSCPTQTQSVSGTYTEQVNATLTITTPPTLTPATTGVAYSTQLTAAGGTPPYTNWAIAAGSLPTGLGLNPSTGVIAGTPTGVGTSTFTVQVTDNAAGTATLAMSLTVSCTPLSISTTTLPSGTQNQLYSFQEQSTGGYGTITWSGNLFPDGIGISGSGLVSGTPTNFGTFTPSIVAQDSCPVPQKVNINPTLVIAQQVGALVITTGNPLPDEVVGQAVNFNMAASGGIPPYTWSNPTGAFPTGVTMNGAGLINGTPTTAGTYTPTIQVTDTQPVSVSQAFNITVTCPAESITTTSLPPATENTAYSFTVQGTGGISPISWAASGLPSGLSMASSTGVISGTPTASGTFAVTITRTDSCLPTGTVASVTLNLQVNNPPLAITTLSLPNGTLNQAYSATLSAAGGTPPYTWAITAGMLQSGLSFNTSTGVISGTPTVASTVSLTFQVTDSASHTATATLSLTVTSSSGGDNRYCGPNGVWTGPATKGPANAPKTCVYTALSATPSPGPVVTVTAGSCSSLQSAVNSAVAGETIVIPHLQGNAQDQITCVIKPAATGNASNWITLTTDDLNNLPAEGNEITPAWAGITSLPGRPGYTQPAIAGVYVPKLIGNGGSNQAIEFQGTAAFWRIIGLEITSPNGKTASQLISGAPGWNHIIIDRPIIHGGNSPVGQDRDDIQNGVAFDACQYCALIDFYIFDTHCKEGDCQSQAVGMGGNSTTITGPLKVVDGFAESAGENIFSGGAGALPPTVIQPSTDGEIRRVDFFKPNFWRTADPNYFGTAFELDNLLEFKNSLRTWTEGNIFQHSSGSQGTQQGNAIIFGPRSQSNGCCSGTASSDGAGNITWISGGKFTSNLVSSFCGVDPGHCMFVYQNLAYEVKTVNSATSLTLQLCVTGCINAGGVKAGATLPPTLSSANFLGYNPGLNPNAVVDDQIFINNYITGAARVGAIAIAVSNGGDLAKEAQRFYWANTGADDIDGWFWNNNFAGAGSVWGTGIQIQGATNTLFPDKIVIDHNTFIQFLTGGNPGVGPNFIWGTPKNNAMTSLQVTNNVSGGGVSPQEGSAETAFLAAIVSKADGCFDHNFFAGTANPFGPNGKGSYGNANNPPYPVAGDSQGCSFGTSGNTVVTDFNAMQFTAPNGGTNVNMQLSATSPGHDAASDGSDAGVNWNTLQTAIAGVGGGPVTVPTVLTTVDSALNSYGAVSTTYNAPGTSGINGPIGTNKWLMYDNPWGITSGSGTITQAYPGSGSMTFTMSLTGLPGAGVDAYPFMLYGCDPYSDCYNGQPPQFPAALSSMTNLYADINYAFSGTITGRDVDLLFDEWVCNNSHPSGTGQCLEVEILPYYNFAQPSGATFVKTITVPVTINGSASTMAFDELKGSNILFVPHTLPGTSSQEIKFDLLTFLNEGVATFGANGPCTPTACTFLAGVELGSEFGDAASQSYALQFTKIELDQILP